MGLEGSVVPGAGTALGVAVGPLNGRSSEQEVRDLAGSDG